VLKKSFWGDDQNFSGLADAFRTRRYEGTTSFHAKTTTELRMSGTEYAVVEPAKNQLLRDFRRRSVFDFCNTIGTFPTSRVDLASSVREAKADLLLESAGFSVRFPCYERRIPRFPKTIPCLDRQGIE
jgi:hypothetical protein